MKIGSRQFPAKLLKSECLFFTKGMMERLLFTSPNVGSSGGLDDDGDDGYT